MNLSDHWYAGDLRIYAALSWLHERDTTTTMHGENWFPLPWTVEAVIPFGYLVLQASNGRRFKMLNNPAVVAGDVIS